MKVSAILLAGGTGSRMNSPIPKQFLPLQGQAVVLHSLKVLLQINQIQEIIVVCAPQYRSFFSGFNVTFAHPGNRRQDSVYHGLQKTHFEWICIHDGARPFVTPSAIHRLFEERKGESALGLALPVKNTLKEIDSTQKVMRTVDRSTIWEIQTPQLIKKEILEQGFAYAHQHALEVTDDLSIVELIGYSPKLIRGIPENIKITTPEDFLFAQWLIHTNTECVSPTMELAIAVGKSNQIASPSKKF